MTTSIIVIFNVIKILGIAALVLGGFLLLDYIIFKLFVEEKKE